jgi:NAD(P)H-dependent flavin oxidoreductase YrpB (nitropropane dioxygenase family)
MSINTPITKLLGIQHPIILAGMYIAWSPELVAAVSNAGQSWSLPYLVNTKKAPVTGGLGVVGGLHFTPAELRQTLQEVKVKIICDRESLS